jgi:hypothetical protein
LLQLRLHQERAHLLAPASLRVAVDRLGQELDDGHKDAASPAGHNRSLEKRQVQNDIKCTWINND